MDGGYGEEWGVLVERCTLGLMFDAGQDLTVVVPDVQLSFSQYASVDLSVRVQSMARK